jgi:glycosyltransferase involved in cell wall biosynthesis
MLVRDEDRFVEWAIRSAIDFCDEFLVCDHGSRDGTPDILARLADEYGDRLVVRRCRDSGESHEMIRGFAGTTTWIFGVDGDEIYDPAGLARMRARLEAGEFDRSWLLFGNVLNVKRLDLAGATAEGHLSPPCRSMTKLYNFAAIDDWSGRIVERLHGGTIRFRPGFDEKLRLNLHEKSDWDTADFRCLHLCFLDRSSIDASGGKPRRNIMDVHTWSFFKVLSRLRAMLGGKPVEDWKEQKYARGPLVTKSLDPFLASHP